MKEYIGVIIINQEEKIYLHNNSYYIKVKKEDSKDIDLLIKQATEKYVNQNIYRNIKIYNKAFKYHEYEIKQNYEIDKMYVVECSVFNNDKFFRKEDIIKLLDNKFDIKIFENTIIKYGKYTRFLHTLGLNIIMASNITMVICDKNNFEVNNYWILSFLLIVLLIISSSIILFNSKITKYLLRYNIRDTFIKTNEYIAWIIMFMYFTVFFIL